MKKTIFYFAAGTFLLASCAKESFEPTNGSNNSRMAVSQGNSSDMHAMNQPFQIQGKSAAESYAYKAYAGSPVINGTPVEATSIVPSGDHVFVSWHTEGTPYGGAVSVYKFDGTNYNYVEVLELYDTDIHDIEVEKNGSVYTVYAAGQRNPDSTAYFINGYKGAVMSRIDYNSASSPKFQLASFMELPLQGFAANAIALDHSYGGPMGSVLAVTGNGLGNSADTNGIYRAPKDFTNVMELEELEDGLYIERDGYTDADRYAVTERVGSDLNIYSLAPSTALPGLGADATISVPGLLNLERSAIAWNSSDDILIAAGGGGLISADWGSGVNNVYDLGSSVIGVTVDATNNLIYASCGEGGLHVLANPGYPGGALVNDYDLIGKFTPPTGGPFPGTFFVKDASIYLEENISIAVGSGGVFFVEKM